MSDTNPLDTISTGIGNLIGSGNALSSIGSGIFNVAQLLAAGGNAVQPYNAQGTASIAATSDVLANNADIGVPRISGDNPVDFESFAKNFNMSEGAKYLLSTAEAQNSNSMASKGSFYSGADMRAQTQIAEGIANTDLLSQYQASLKGQQQDFSQRETSFENLFGTEALGEKAGASQTLEAASGAGTIGGLFQSQAGAQQSKGSGLGGIVGGALNFLSK